MTTIDPRVEPLLREAFNAAMAKDPDRLERALRSFPEDREEVAFGLAVTINAAVVNDIHKGQPPSEERVQYLVDGFRQMESWYDSSQLPVEQFMRWLAGATVDPPEPGTVGLLSILVGAWLLASFLPDGVQWYEYLDEVLDRIDLAGRRSLEK